MSVLRCFANWLLAATASLLFRHRHLSFVPPAHLRLHFNGIRAFLPCLWAHFLYLKPVVGIFSSFQFVAPPEEVSPPSPQQKLPMFGTFANWEIMSSYVAADGCKKKKWITQNHSAVNYSVNFLTLKLTLTGRSS